MELTNCPECGHPSEDPSRGCSRCGLGLAGDEVPPDLLDWARQTFDEKEYLVGVEEIKRTGGLRFEDFIGEIEERVRRQ